MSLSNLEIVDIVSTDTDGNTVLTISDEVEGDDENAHLLPLQNKINLYLSFIESGNLNEEYPSAVDSKKVINVVAKYEPNLTAIQFLEITKGVLESAGSSMDMHHVDDCKKNGEVDPPAAIDKLVEARKPK